MCALGKRRSDGNYEGDTVNEPPFTEAELERAAALRQRVSPDGRYTNRRDQCPHATICESWEACVKQIAWYLRHQHEIEAAEQRHAVHA